jgi:hypothetical protein
MMVPVASASAAELRLVHGVPGVGEAALEADGEPGEAVGFGEVSDYQRVPNGEVDLALGAVRTTETLSSGRYTVVAWPSGGKPKLSVFRDGSARAGKARLRAIHAAGEVGAADVLLDGKTAVGRLGRGKSSGYLTVEPGTYAVKVMRPSGKGGALVGAEANLAAGSASTAVVVGSGGKPVQVALATDSVAAPAQGPATGLGGLEDDGPPWAAVLLAALCAGALGGGAYRLARRRGA